MFGQIAKFLFVVTSISPIALVMAWVAFRENYYYWAGGLVALCLVLVCACLLLLHLARGNLERFSFATASVEAADRENMAFMLLYLSPLFTAKFESMDFNVWIPTLVIFALMTATGYNYHFNPLLGLLGWHFYKVTSKEGVTYVLVTRKQLRRAGQVQTVGQMTEYILIELEDDHAR